MFPGPANIPQKWEKINPENILKIHELLDGSIEPNPANAILRLYSEVYSLCAAYGDEGKKELYDGYREFMSSITGKALASLNEKQDVHLLLELIKLWKYYRRMVRYYSKAFAYLDRGRAVGKRRRPVHELGIGQFTEVIFPTVKNKIRSVLLGLVRKERNGEKVDQALMKDTFEVFIEMDPKNMSTYMSEFEEQFLSETAEFYSHESSRWLDDSSPSSCLEKYLNKAEQCLQEELQRVTHYLHITTKPKLMKVCHDSFFVHHEQELREMEKFVCEALLRDNQVEGLSRMYRLFSQLETGLPPILQKFENHILAEGWQLVEKYIACEESGEYIYRLMSMHHKYLEIIDKCFASNNLFHEVLPKAFLLFINKETGKKSTVHHLATYCGTLLKQSEDNVLQGPTATQPTSYWRATHQQAFLFLINKEIGEKKTVDHLATYCNALLEQGGEKVCDDSFLMQHKQKKQKSENVGSNGMLRDIPVERLSRMYHLFSQFETGLLAILQTFEKHILDEWQQLANMYVACNESIQYINRLFFVYDKYLELIDKSFASDKRFHEVLSEAFILFINKETGEKSTVHHLAKYFDTLLKQGGEKAIQGSTGTQPTFYWRARPHQESTDENHDHQLDKVVALLRYVQNTDVFEALYQQDLARRLIFNTGTSIEAEKSMISKLENELGASFSSKLDVVLRDMELSRDLTSSFNKVPGSSNNVDINVKVLKMGSWTNYQTMDLKLPVQLLNIQEKFQVFYLKKYSGRKISWNHHWSSCILTAHFPLGKKELVVSLFQAVIILLFNHAECLSLKDIREQTGIEDREITRVVSSSTISNMIIPLNEPAAQELNDDDIFSINNNFTSEMYTIRLNAIEMHKTSKEKQQATNLVIQDRNCQIDAALVRIMKTRKQLSHNLLVSEASNQLKFHVKLPDFKKRIESLIEREYLARDKDNADVYIYLP